MSNDLGGGGATPRESGLSFTKIEVNTAGIQGFGEKVQAEIDTNYTPNVTLIQEMFQPGSSFGMGVNADSFYEMFIAGRDHMRGIEGLGELIGLLSGGLWALNGAALYAAMRYPTEDTMNAADVGDVQLMFDTYNHVDRMMEAFDAENRAKDPVSGPSVLDRLLAEMDAEARYEREEMHNALDHDARNDRPTVDDRLGTPPAPEYLGDVPIAYDNEHMESGAEDMTDHILDEEEAATEMVDNARTAEASSVIPDG